MSLHRASSLGRYLPILGWARGYSREDLTADLLAGGITAILLVPQSMAFGVLAGLPPEAGLYASILPPIVYAVLGTSRTLAVGPVSVAAIMVAQALAGVPAGSQYLTSALTLALLGGLMLLALGVLRLGLLANFLSHPVLSGFTSAAAILIVLSQVPSLLGIRLPHAGSIADLPAWMHDALRAINLSTAWLGMLCVVLLLLAGLPLERALVRVGMDSRRASLLGKTAPLAVVLLGTAAVIALDLDSAQAVAVVGAIPAGLPALRLDLPSAQACVALLPAAALIALVAYVESVSIAKTLAHRKRQTIDPNQELLALGTANLAAGLSGGLPVAGGFSRTMVNYNAGARTQAAALVTAVLVGLVALVLTPVLKHVPKAALAAIIIVAVSRLIDLRGALAVWRYDRLDGAVLIVTGVGVLGLGIELGLALGLALSLLAYIWRASRPHLAELGRLPGSEHFRNVRRYDDLETWPTILLLRIDEHLSFANCAYVEEAVMERVAQRRQVQDLVLVASGINGVDVSALEMLHKLVHSLREAGVTLHLAEVKGPVMDRLKHSALLRGLAPGRVFLSAHEAVEVLSARMR